MNTSPTKLEIPTILLHPNGFLQVELANGNRLHIWAKDLPQAQKVYTPIHDHTFDFESRVVLGILRDCRYSYIAGYPQQRFQGTIVEVHHVIGENLEPSGLFGVTNQESMRLLRPGDTYSLRRGTFHVSESASDLTATIMRKTWKSPSTGFVPSVLVPLGVIPDNEFRRDQYPSHVLWPWVKHVLSFMEERGDKQTLRV